MQLDIDQESHFLEGELHTPSSLDIHYFVFTELLHQGNNSGEGPR
jgi:hypothetical protein